MSYSQTSRVQTCMCSTMKSRLDDLKQRKSQKQELYDEVLKKYGKNSNVQKVLLSTFKTPHSSLSLADIEQKIHKFESKTPNFHSLSEPSCRIKSVESNQKSLKYPEVSKKFNKTSQQPHRKFNEEEAWAAIVKHDSMLYLQEEQSKFLRSEENRDKLRLVLNNQVREKNRKMLREQLQNLEYDKEQEDYWKNQEIREKKIDEEIKKKSLEQRKIMNQFMSDVKQRKIDEAVKAKTYEKELVKIIKRKMIEEQMEKNEKKEMVKQSYIAVIKENEEKSKIKAQQALKEKLQDMQVMKDYTKMLDKQEQDRINFLKNREMRIQTAINPKSCSILEDLRFRNLKEDLQIHQSMQEQFLREKAKEDLDAKVKASQAKKLKEFYEVQINEKNKRKRIEFDFERQFMDDMKKDNQKYEKWNQEKQQKDKDLKLLHARYLKMQIEEKGLSN